METTPNVEELVGKTIISSATKSIVRTTGRWKNSPRLEFGTAERFRDWKDPVFPSWPATITVCSSDGAQWSWGGDRSDRGSIMHGRTHDGRIIGRGELGGYQPILIGFGDGGYQDFSESHEGGGLSIPPRDWLRILNISNSAKTAGSGRLNGGLRPDIMRLSGYQSQTATRNTQPDPARLIDTEGAR